jgi:DNA-binding CsgD family transcriptional regulator
MPGGFFRAAALARGVGAMQYEHSRSPSARNSGGAPSHDVLQAVANSEFPVVLIETGSERLLSASAQASQLLAGHGATVIDRQLTEFIRAKPSDAPALLQLGRLNGYHSHRSLTRSRAGATVDLWLRSFDDEDKPQLAIGLLRTDKTTLPDQTDERVEPDHRPVTGVLDGQLRVARIDDESQPVLGLIPHRLIGRSLLDLLHPGDVGNLLWALAQATSSRSGVSLRLRLNRPATSPLACELALLPLAPAPSCVISLQVAEDFPAARRSSAELLRLLLRWVHTVQAVNKSTPTVGFGRRAVTLDDLTGRELEIVRRLLAGDRVPAIAQSLFITQSTVRNHLSSVFAKLGVTSQQELIVLLRRVQRAEGTG